jgi:hypothetical protein
MPEDGRERHPAPVHLVLTQESHYLRSIELSVQLESPYKNTVISPSPDVVLGEADENASPGIGSGCRGASLSTLTNEDMSFDVPYLADSLQENKSTFETAVPRLAFAIWLKDNFRVDRLSTDLFVEWL